VTSRPSSPIASVSPLVYWLLVVGGLLAAHRVLEHTDASRAVALWVGAVSGTALGQVAAYKRLPLWLVATVLPMLAIAIVWSALVLDLGLLRGHDCDPFQDLQLWLMAFFPAVLCGWASLSERGGLAAFWFPSSLWAVAILDSADAGTLGGARSAAHLGVLAVLFVAFLVARERRRVALWQSHAATRLSVMRPAAVLRQSPARSVAQAAWVAATTAATVALTTWVAPHLWQTEKAGTTTVAPVSSPGGAVGHADGVAGVAGAATCCREAPPVEVESHRLREYLPLLKAHEDRAYPTAPVACVPCRDGVPIDTAPTGVAPTGVPSLADAGSCGVAAPAAQGSLGTAPALVGPTPAVPGSPHVSPGHAPPPAPPVAEPLAPAQVQAPPTPEPPLLPSAAAPAPAHEQPPATPPPPDHVAAASAALQAPEARPVAWLLALVVSALLVQLALRPLRRAVTLHHLREPLWPEAVDQRVSNLWQLVLVGLRDAGWRALPGEPPQDLARRVALPGADTCARVLERTRHGARLDAGDVEAMKHAAGSVYRSARGRSGRLARLLSWLRWPLVE
jgi:hypothetical protein